MTHASNTDTNDTDGWQVDGRVYIVCSNFTLAAGGTINVDYKGFQPIGYIKGAGPGGGSMPVNGQNPGGGGYGGAGGNGTHAGGAAYGSTNAPDWPGSAGGGSYNFSMPGSAGGGLVWIVATNATIDGTISANGANGYTVIDGTGGGSGGGIYIQCGTLSGSGTIRANGGTGGNYAGGGGGGRIALDYVSAAWTGSIQVNGASGAPNYGYPASARGGYGTLYLSDTTPLQGGIIANQGYHLYSANNLSAWTYESLVMSNAYLALTASNVVFTVTNDLLLHNSTLLINGFAGDTNATRIAARNLTLTNSTLNVQAGVITATNVYLRNGASMTHAVNSAVTTNAAGQWPIDGWLQFICAADFLLDTGAVIDVNSKGYQGRYATSGAGPGAAVMNPGTANPGGAGHGGPGGSGGYPGGPEYDATNAPTYPGSSGAGSPNYNTTGGSGGGLVLITASNVTINGTISANGASGTQNVDGSGGGSGGSIAIACTHLAGSGTLTANGGAGRDHSGGGAGGRIALNYQTTAWTGAVQVNGASGSPNYGYPAWASGTMGSLYASDSAVLLAVMSGVGIHFFSPSAIFAMNSLVLTNASRFWCNMPNTSMSISNDLAIYGSGSSLDLGGAAGDTPRTLLSVGGNLTVAGGSLIMRSGITNQVSTNDQELVRVNGTLLVTNSGAVYPYSYQFPPQRTNAGGSVRFEVGNLIVAAGATINANGTGFAGDREGYGNQGGFGPGGAPGYWNTGGGGHGAPGGKGGNYLGGAEYGSSNAPVLPGSGGGYTKHGSGPWQGGNGGGLVRVKANGTIQIDGTINADASAPGPFDGGGSGGGVYLHCYTFKGAGTITAKGSNAGQISGAGAGGRIAVWYRKNEWTGTLSYPDSVAPGAPYGGGYIPLAGTGTVCFVEIPPPGTVVLIQ